MTGRELPIWDVHQALIRPLQSGNRLVLVAPTGSGKTTQVPQMVLDGGLAGPKKVVVLQPRRVAARTVAARVAWERQTPLGQEVGYQVRFDDRTAPGTRISFLTEGVLLRRLQEDPGLQDIGALLFDEFHERNLLSDVALALAKRLQETTRPDLKIAVMSATLDAEPVAAYLGGCPIVVSEGTSWPVEVRYLDVPDERPVTEQASDAVEAIISSGAEGDILVFMPGMGEIQGTINALRAARLTERVALIPLHGELSPEDQDLAFATNPLRKVVIATNVAETSVTIDGIRHVVDGGLARVARYDAERGIGTLGLEPISRASADQRRGRAGRTAPGTCWRLWTESGHLNRADRNTPEIRRSDLAEVVLLLHSLGIRKAVGFDWLDKPDPQAVDRAEELLRLLGALRPSAEGEGGDDLTPVGRQMLRLPMHPRYSRMLVEAARHACVPAAALCAALVSGRDLLQRLGRDEKHISEARELFEGSALSDFYTLIRAYQFAKNNDFGHDRCRRYGINAKAAREVEQTFEQILEITRRHGLLREPPASPQGEKPAAVTPATPPPPAKPAADPLLRCLVAGFADQLAVRRDTGTLDCDLTGGRQGTLVRESVVQQERLMVVASIREVPGRGSGNLTLLGLATAAKREWLAELYPDQVTSRVEHLFDRGQKRVAAVRLIRFADLVIDHEHQREVDPEASARCLASAFLRGWFELPLLSHDLKQFIARVNLIAAASPDLEFPAFDPDALHRALTRAFHGMTLVKEAQAAHLREAFQAHLAPEQRAWLDELMPLSVPWPDGRKVKLTYPESPLDEDGETASPEAQMKLHECFPVKEHPHILEGKMPVKLWLCSPDGKRLEPTFNWPAFRTNTYPRIRGALSKKYPGVGWL
ncbi:MAG TPA: helicase [Verrucomicrobiales bacterium]|nr:helicase [Verrucomicrobiales bacterium]